MPVFKRLSLIVTTLWLTAQTALAAGGGDAQPVVIVADSRKLSGVMTWWAKHRAVIPASTAPAAFH